jgi:hypothetical protein
MIKKGNNQKRIKKEIKVVNKSRNVNCKKKNVII